MPFVYKSYKILQKELGYSDVINEMSEMIIREFMDTVQLSNEFEIDYGEIAKRHGIHLNFSDMNEVTNSLSRNYLVNSYSVVENFFREFRKEYCELHDTDWNFDDKESKLKSTVKNVIDNAKLDEAIEKIGTFNYNVMEYYRLVRNATVHDIRRTKNVPNEFYQETKIGLVDKYEQYGLIKAPNKYENINFNDFLLYSRVSKNIAYSLSCLTQPSLYVIANRIKLEKYDKFENKPKRRKNAIIGEIKSDYGYNFSELEQIYKIIIEKHGSLA